MDSTSNRDPLCNPTAFAHNYGKLEPLRISVSQIRPCVFVPRPPRPGVLLPGMIDKETNVFFICVIVFCTKVLG